MLYIVKHDYKEPHYMHAVYHKLVLMRKLTNYMDVVHHKSSMTSKLFLHVQIDVLSKFWKSLEIYFKPILVVFNPY